MSYGDTPNPGGSYSSGQPINGTLILVLGILGLVVCGFLAPVAWVMGNNAIKTPGAPPDQVNLANIGRILGIIGTVFIILGCIWFFFLGGLAMIGVMSGAHSLSTPPSGPGFLPL